MLLLSEFFFLCVLQLLIMSEIKSLMNYLQSHIQMNVCSYSRTKNSYNNLLSKGKVKPTNNNSKNMMQFKGSENSLTLRQIKYYNLRILGWAHFSVLAGTPQHAMRPAATSNPKTKRRKQKRKRKKKEFSNSWPNSIFTQTNNEVEWKNNFFSEAQKSRKENTKILVNTHTLTQTVATHKHRQTIQPLHSLLTVRKVQELRLLW